MVRWAVIADSARIRDLMEQLGFPFAADVMEKRVERLLVSTYDDILVYESDGVVQGLITMHFSPQLGFDGDFCELGYMVVDENARGQNIGTQLEEAVTQLAKDRRCYLISVFSQGFRKDAHRFYERQGYKALEKYFEKKL